MKQAWSHSKNARSLSIRLVSLVGLFAVTLSLGACNTMRGMGQDVERGGEHVQDAATGVQKKM